MASQYARLLDPHTIVANFVPGRENWLDLGAYRVLEVSFRVLKSGTGTDATALVKLQHAPVMEDEAFIDLVGATARTDSTATSIPTFVEVPAFTRYIRWVASSSVAGSPIVLIDLVAKE